MEITGIIVFLVCLGLTGIGAVNPRLIVGNYQLVRFTLRVEVFYCELVAKLYSFLSRNFKEYSFRGKSLKHDQYTLTVYSRFMGHLDKKL